MERLYSTKEAAKILKEYGVSYTEGTLEVWRSQGRGPRYRRRGRNIFYTKPDLWEFAKGVVVETNDSRHESGNRAEVA